MMYVPQAKKRRDWLAHMGSVDCPVCSCHASEHEGFYSEGGLIGWLRRWTRTPFLLYVVCGTCAFACWTTLLPSTRWQAVKAVLGLRWWTVRPISEFMASLAAQTLERRQNERLGATAQKNEATESPLSPFFEAGKGICPERAENGADAALTAASADFGRIVNREHWHLRLSAAGPVGHTHAYNDATLHSHTSAEWERIARETRCEG